MEQDLVSVIVPVYNRAEYVGETISSILAQTYQAIEIVLVNDGSTDNSLAVLRKFEEQYSQKIIIIDQKNQGQVASRNNAIRRAKGKYIAFLDSDDVWLPRKLELQMPLFISEKTRREREKVGLVYCAIDNIDEHGKTLDTVLCDDKVTGDILPQLLIRNRMTGGTVVVTREALDRVGLFDEAFSAAENWDLWIRICRHYEARLVNMPLVQYRVHSGNMSKDRMLMLSAKEAIVNKHCSGTPETKEMAGHYQLAKADLAYWKGVYFFSKAEYPQSRVFFREALALIPNYQDSRIRILRSYLGNFGNRAISFCKNLINKVFRNR